VEKPWKLSQENFLDFSGNPDIIKLVPQNEQTTDLAFKIDPKIMNSGRFFYRPI